MKLLLVQLAALSTAFVLPNEQLSNLRHVELEASRGWDHVPSKSQVLVDVENTFSQISQELEDAFDYVSEEIESKFEEYSTKSQNALENALASAEDGGSQVKSGLENAYYETQDWVDSAAKKLDSLDTENILGHHGGHHQGKSNKTVYQLIASSNYTTQLAKLINEYDDLVEALNGTAANYTVFAPTDSAFKKLPKNHKLSKKVLREILTYHVSPDFYPAGRILLSRTIETLFKSASLGKKPLPQRLSTSIGLGGLKINFLTRVVAIDIFGTNGVIHAVDSLILPPPNITTIVDLSPSDFSTLELALYKTGLYELINGTNHAGGTLFAPGNYAFSKLGHKVNAFLFSEYGLKYLKALLEYHMVPCNTLYSDAYYKSSSSETTNVPKGTFHVDLPTVLKDRSLNIDIARYGRLIEIKINAFYRVATPDLVANDGVVHIMDDVIIPPKKLDSGEMENWTGETELTVEELKERLEPLVEHDAHSEEL